MATYEKNKLYMVPLAEIQRDPNQPRQYYEPVALEELTASVRQHGIIEPVVCRQDPATSIVYNVAGDRRCAAARLAGLTHVPAIFIDGGNYAEIALVENLLRQDLNPVEEAEALQKLMDSHAYQQDQLAAVIGKSQPTISLTLSINRLPKEIKDICRQDPTVPKRTLIEIAAKKQERSMLTRFRKYQEQQAKAANKETEAAAPAERKRSRAESLINNIGVWSSKIGDLEFPEFTKAERTGIIEAMNSLKETLDEAIPRAVKNQKKPV